MELLSEKVSEVIKNVPTTLEESNTVQEVGKLIEELKKAGLIKTPSYSLPQVDTIGKTYYSSINKR